ncbi:LysE family transporter [Azoarcus sp. L1K30]|uniref:LysE family translocator n=1 Tax=Azoarcus sp. L1K30 TaxID=2820277 RepID=UPI001B828D52|nr:LysE family transporter [Azoarcus sp. L1K30]MBR0565128.1 LysE family transporter [Azoarcus sp. L1K30]
MLIKGLLLGFSIAAPVGPIGLLCLRRGLERGFLAAFTSGLGAATADACYGLVGALGLAAVSTLLIGQTAWLRVGGGIFLLWLAWQTWRAAPSHPAATGGGGRLWRGYLSTLLLTLSNPMTILSFAAIFAGLGIAEGDRGDGVLLVVGVFLGSALWWSMLAWLATHLAARIGPRQLIAINRLSALALGGFAVWSFIGAV